jgi:SAM-dependent methyltransferase
MNELDRLNLAIDKIDKIDNSTWQNILTDRKKKELEFHDKDRDCNVVQETLASDTYEKFYGNKKFYKITNRSQSYVQSWIRLESKNKIFLDYACGNGENATSAAKYGALLSLGFDISGVSVKNATKLANEKKINNVRFFQADAENTKLPDDSIDVIICSGMLHHLDLSYAFPELRRILKPGGKILAIEALDYNPAIKLYRTLTPAMRTDWEKAHILSLNDIKFAKRFFDIGVIRHWHVLGYVGGKIPFLMYPMDLIDRVLEKIPLIKLLSWMFTFELIKRVEK